MEFDYTAGGLIHHVPSNEGFIKAFVMEQDRSVSSHNVVKASNHSDLLARLQKDRGPLGQAWHDKKYDLIRSVLKEVMESRQKNNK